MKRITLLFFLFLFVCVSAQAYRAGGKSRPSFGGSAASSSESAVPGATSNVQTRTFSTYSSRQPAKFAQGVKTEGVKTQVAGQAYQDKTEDAIAQVDKLAASAPSTQAAPATGKKGAAPVAEKNDKKTSPAPDTVILRFPAGRKGADNVSAGTPAAASAQQQNPAALLQQMQGMMQGMAGATGGAAGAGGAASAGMGDISALMNMMPGGAPAQPAKK